MLVVYCDPKHPDFEKIKRNLHGVRKELPLKMVPATEEDPKNVSSDVLLVVSTTKVPDLQINHS